MTALLASLFACLESSSIAHQNIQHYLVVGNSSYTHQTAFNTGDLLYMKQDSIFIKNSASGYSKGSYKFDGQTIWIDQQQKWSIEEWTPAATVANDSTIWVVDINTLTESAKVNLPPIFSLRSQAGDTSLFICTKASTKNEQSLILLHAQVGDHSGFSSLYAASIKRITGTAAVIYVLSRSSSERIYWWLQSDSNGRNNIVQLSSHALAGFTDTFQLEAQYSPDWYNADSLQRQISTLSLTGYQPKLLSGHISLGSTTKYQDFRRQLGFYSDEVEALSLTIENGSLLLRQGNDIIINSTFRFINYYPLLQLTNHPEIILTIRQDNEGFKLQLPIIIGEELQLEDISASTLDKDKLSDIVMKTILKKRRLVEFQLTGL